MKKSIVFVLVVLCCSLLFSQGSNEISLFEDRSHFAFITDKSNSDIVLDGANNAVKEFYPYLQVDVLRITNNSEAEALVLSSINSNYDAILSYGESSAIVKNLSYEYPEKRFASLSDATSTSLPRNYSEFYFDFNPTSFLCGVGAYSLTDTRKVGVIAFSDDERVNTFIEGFKEAGPNGNVEVYFIEENTDDDTLRLILDILYINGSDIVFTLIGNRTDTVINKSRELGEYVIVGDNYYPADSTVILSVNKDIRRAVSLVIGKMKEGYNGGESIALGIKDSVLDLSWFLNGESLKNLDDNMKTKIVDAKSLLRRYRFELINGPQI